MPPMTAKDVAGVRQSRMRSAFTESLQNLAGMKRLVFLCGNQEEIDQGVEVVGASLGEAGKPIVDLDFGALDPGDVQLYQALVDGGVSLDDPRLDESQMCKWLGRNQLEPDGQSYKWAPPEWWPAEPTAVLCRGLDPNLHEVVLFHLVRLAVLDDHEAENREEVPETKLPDGSYFLVASPEWEGIIRRMASIASYASGEILELRPPFDRYSD